MASDSKLTEPVRIAATILRIVEMRLNSSEAAEALLLARANSGDWALPCDIAVIVSLNARQYCSQGYKLRYNVLHERRRAEPEGTSEGRTGNRRWRGRSRRLIERGRTGVQYLQDSD